VPERRLRETSKATATKADIQPRPQQYDALFGSVTKLVVLGLTVGDNILCAPGGRRASEVSVHDVKAHAA
jgi:hypothetical protein